MKLIKKRIDLTESEYLLLLEYFDFARLEEKKHIDTAQTLFEALKSPKDIEYSFKKFRASETATRARSTKAKEKIQNAINILRMEGKNITHYSIAQMSGVSFNTVKKYINDDTIISLNEMK